MGKIRKQISELLPFIIILLIVIPVVISEKREHEREKVERKAEKEEKRKQYEIKYKVEKFKQPMVWNGNSLLIGYLFKDATIHLEEESEKIIYAKSYATNELGIKAFDSLRIEICNHHCDSIAPYNFTSQYHRMFECSHTGASITLRYQGSEKGRSHVEITYQIPQKLGHGVGEEWQQYLVVEKNKRED